MKVLIDEQLRAGGVTVLRGGDPTPFANDFAAYILWDYTDAYEERWVGLGTKRDDNICTGKETRPHYVCVVEAGADRVRDPPQHQPRRMDGSGITFEDGVSPIIQASLRRLHQNLGHPRKEDLVRHLRLAGCEEAVLKAVKGMQCDVCASTAGPKISRPSTVPRMYDFNDCVGADLLHHHDSEDQRHTFLSIVDWGTSYHVAVPLKGLDSEDIEKAFNDHWVVPFGPPKRVSLDLDGAVQKGNLQAVRLARHHGAERRCSSPLAGRYYRTTRGLVEEHLGTCLSPDVHHRRRGPLGGKHGVQRKERA